MFGIRLRTLFTSRWFALLWAVLVILTAINFVGVGNDRDGGDAHAAASDGITNDQRAALGDAL